MLRCYYFSITLPINTTLSALANTDAAFKS